MESSAPREYLIDVSRLIWRLWSGRLPTGIDRVCLRYVANFGKRSQAVVQFRGQVLVLSSDASDRLFNLVMDGGIRFRRRLLGLGASILASGLPGRSAPRAGTIYLNVGHTGLHEPALGRWIARNRARAVYLIHDLIPITHPLFCRPGERSKHAKRIRNALASASAIIANSRATLDELADFALASGLAMPPGVAAMLGAPDFSGRAKPPNVNRPYFVALGTIEGRKNHILLLRVWKKLVEDGGDEAPLLVIIGQRGWEAEAVLAVLDDLGELGPHVIEIGRCEDDELAGWLAGARALLMPSFVEGFGLPVIEALHLGTPVIASDLPVYEEIAGDIPLYLDPRDEPAWRQAIEDFTSDSADRARQVEAARDYRAPGWEAHFATVEAFLAKIGSS